MNNGSPFRTSGGNQFQSPDPGAGLAPGNRLPTEENKDGGFIDFHPAPTRQYVLYLTASVEIGLGDGTSILMEPGDVLRAEDTTGHGHTSTIRQGGMCAFVPFED